MAKAPSVLDRIKELDAERARLLEEAKATALANAEQAVAELNELGFNYRLVQGSASAPKAPKPSATGRRSGIRESVLEAIQNAGPDGSKRYEIVFERKEVFVFQSMYGAVKAVPVKKEAPCSPT